VVVLGGFRVVAFTGVLLCGELVVWCLVVLLFSCLLCGCVVLCVLVYDVWRVRGCVTWYFYLLYILFCGGG